MSTNNIQPIQHGIVFLMAEWSGGSQWAHRQLVHFLDKRGFSPEQLTVLNVDHHPELYDMPEFVGKIHGWGEAAVVKNGRIVFVTVLGKDQGRFQEYFDDLLRAYDT